MQPTSLPSTLPSARRRRRGLVATGVVTLALLVAACGGDSDDESGSDTTAPTEQSTDAGSESGGGDSSTTEAAGSDVDICAAITQADMEEIIPNAEFTTVAPNSAIPVPTCDYSVDIGGVDGAVIRIDQSSTDGAYFDGQRDLQTDATDVEGVPDAFAFGDYGTILVKTDSGVYTIVRGVEPAAGAEPVSAEQMTQIAALVAEL